jgi:ABC-type glycerol-3-phosphate transport system substrate-binding protein
MRFTRCLIVLVLLATGCGLLPGRASPTGSPAATNVATLVVTPGTPGTPVGAGETAGGATATPGGPAALRVWLPPDFTPDLDTPGGRLLAEQIQAFENAYPGTAVEIRTKAPSGPGGLMASLAAAANAAPGVMPDVIALRRDDLAAAVAAGLVTPPEPLVPADLLNDFYPFAQAMGKVNGTWQGLPFAADARVMAYLTSVYPSPPLRWADMLTGTLVIPAAEPSGLTLLTIYLAQGGALQDASGKTMLDVDVLARTLALLQGLQSDGTLSQSTVDYADPAETWEVFRQRRANLAVTSAHFFLAEYSRVEGASATLLPTGGEAPLALVDGWSWVLVAGTTQPGNQALAAELVGWLLRPEEHAAWTEAANVLPTRAASLANWQETRLGPIVSDVAAHAQLQPPAAVVGSVGPALRQALADVLAGRATPFAAATLAASTVAQP